MPAEGRDKYDIKVLFFFFKSIINEKNMRCPCTSDLGVQRRDIGTVRMSDALQALLYSHEGNLTVAMPSCSLMDMTIPALPRTPFPTTCRRREKVLTKKHVFNIMIMTEK